MLFAPTFPVTPGARANHDIMLTNEGEADTFKLTLSEELDYLEMPETQELVLGAGESRVLEVAVRVPRDAEPFRGDTITVGFVSQQNPAANTFAVVQLEVLRTLEVDLDLFPQQLDNCPEVSSPQQLDTDGKGDACDADSDADSVDDDADNCPLVANRDQLDTDRDDLGDACDRDPNCACTLPGSSAWGSEWWLVVVAAAGVWRLGRGGRTRRAGQRP